MFSVKSYQRAAGRCLCSLCGGRLSFLRYALMVCMSGMLGMLGLLGPVSSASAAGGMWAAPGAPFYVLLNNSSYVTCSIGVPLADRSGKHYFMTAGHCFRTPHGRHMSTARHSGLKVVDPVAGRVVGHEVFSTRPHGSLIDISVIAMNPGARFSDTYSPVHLSTVSARNTLGSSACLLSQHNRRPDADCGKIIHKNTTSQVGYPWPMRGDVAQYCASVGDSGGLVYNRSGILGIQTSAQDPGATHHCVSHYVDIHAALAAIHSAPIPGLHIAAF